MCLANNYRLTSAGYKSVSCDRKAPRPSVGLLFWER
nr:MAG TPA: hypothetical protein [Caudoviricetes sp.]